MLDDFVQNYSVLQNTKALACFLCTMLRFNTLHSPHPFPLRLHASDRIRDYVSECSRSDVLSISKVKTIKQGVLLWDWLAIMILIQEDR